MYLTNFNIFEEVKQATDCRDLMQELGFHVNKGGFINCLDPGHEDKDPSRTVPSQAVTQSATEGRDQIGLAGIDIPAGLISLLANHG
ncbi:MAG: hypothetical protein Q7I94_03470 [Candidatus Contubernalis sp.]|nr:hypothetical protein [Candidatus Contubernalis sp.]